MNCESISLLLTAALDGELSTDERSVMDQHLATCESCNQLWADLQSLDRSLAGALRPPTDDPRIDHVISAIQDRVSNASSGPDRNCAETLSPAIVGLQNTHRQLPRSGMPLLVMIASLALVAVAMFQLPTSMPSVAEITMATGPIEIKQSERGEWIAVSKSNHIPLSKNVRVRTGTASLCEIRTKSDAVVRLNQDTELILRQPEQIELIAGELWCRTPPTASLEICGTAPPKPAALKAIFTCPSSSESQWAAAAENELSCIGVSAKPIEVKTNLSGPTCEVGPGERWFFGSNHAPTEAGHADSLIATTWQLPLLILRRPDDLELQDRMVQLLGMVGETKISYAYESQIRNLGSAGTLPLIAFVQSSNAADKQQLRQRAMRIVADLAPISAFTDLESLRKDPDPVVRQFAQTALRRLEPNRRLDD